MRILRLDLSTGDGTVDLHPFISIVQGLDSNETTDLIDAIRGLVRGSTTGHGGLVESNGELIELRSGAAPIGPLTIEDIYVTVGGQEDDGDPVVLVADRDRAKRFATIARVKLEEARANIDPGAAHRVRVLQNALTAFEVPEGEMDRTSSARSMIGRVRSLPTTVRNMPEDIREMLTEWERYEEARRQTQPELDALSQRVQSCLAQREAAQIAVEESIARAVPVVLNREEDIRVENLANPDVSGKKARRSTDDDHRELQGLLAKVGQTSYLDYVMYRLAPVPSAASLADLEAARTNLEQVEARLGEARFEMQFGPVQASLNEVLESVKETARVHLGPMLPSDLGAALRRQVVESPNPEFSEALRDLYHELRRVEAEVPDAIQPEELVAWAEAWADEIDRPVEHTGPTRAQLFGQMTLAEQDLEMHDRAMARVEGLEADAEQAAADLAATDERLRSSIGDVGTSADRALALLRPLADRVRAEAGGSVPLILHGDFADLSPTELQEMFDHLEVLAQDLQLIVLCDRADAATWAGEVGLRRALGSQVSYANA